jgi:hypothetical protein
VTLENSPSNVAATDQTFLHFISIDAVMSAESALEKGLALRPGSNAINIALPKRNASWAFLAASDRLIKALVAVGLPEG